MKPTPAASMVTPAPASRRVGGGPAFVSGSSTRLLQAYPRPWKPRLSGNPASGPTNLLSDIRGIFPIAVVEAKAEDLPAAPQGIEPGEKSMPRSLGLSFAYATNGQGDYLEFDYLAGTEKAVQDFATPERAMGATADRR